MVSIPQSLMFPQKHASPYPPASWFPNYMAHPSHHANNQFLNGTQSSISTQNGLLDSEATAYSHYHMIHQQASPDWAHDPYGIPTPGAQFYPNGMTPTSMHLSPTANHHNTSAGSDHLQNSLANIPPSPPITVNSGCSEMSSPGIVPNGLGNQIGNGNSSPNLGNSDHSLSRTKSPYEWMKKQSYQNQPNPGMCRIHLI